MQKLELSAVQDALQNFIDQTVYLHLETTNGAYANHFNEKVMTVNAFIRNTKVNISRATVTGKSPYRVGLKLDEGWVVAEGLTDFEIDDENRLLLAGHNEEGKLAIALQLSHTPF
ncbi:YojF family protein [Gottfriedia solisilvae]|uniref:DUF1806 domain-containing protein n=1 Tax=Gottfriedia solisilvae TaxID=1516104 RepID=A0A8J3AF79_9BACI|nr:YojF family protein [Gottfriedia solisilvae]GGI11932.1 hypothetical protein GCM10007380_10320 [Gottfriedia solisilvae]